MSLIIPGAEGRKEHIELDISPLEVAKGLQSKMVAIPDKKVLIGMGHDALDILGRPKTLDGVARGVYVHSLGAVIMFGAGEVADVGQLLLDGTTIGPVSLSGEFVGFGFDDKRTDLGITVKFNDAKILDVSNTDEISLVGTTFATGLNVPVKDIGLVLAAK